jgi:myxalamid-type polyketide synthase MxaE and MxaD
VLTGRSALPARDAWDGIAEGTEDARKIAGIRAVEWLGATVHVASLDIADEPAASAFFDRFGVSIPPLRGIIHAAATMGAAKVREMPAAALADMIRPKMDGAFVLHRLTQGIELDFFVLFSSISALIGTTDLAHYAAGNSAIDAFAEYRRARGLAALSVNWGAWENLRGSEQHKDVFARSGMRLLSSRSSLDLLGRLIAGNETRAVVADVDWKTFKPVYEVRRRRPFLDAVDGAPAVAAAPRAVATLREEIASVESDRQADVILSHVRAAAAGVLGLAARQLDPQRGFFDLGMDSLLSVELRRRLEASTGLALPGTLTFKYPTVAAVAGFLATELLAPAAAQGAPDAPAAPAAANGDVDDLSEDDLAALLASKLAQIQ